MHLELNCIFRVRSNCCKPKNNLNQEQNHNNIEKRSCFRTNIKLNRKNYTVLVFTIFSIVMPTGIQPQMPANYAFAQVNSHAIDEVEFNEEGEISSSSSSSDSNEAIALSIADSANSK